MPVQIRDPVHDFIPLREKERRLLATPTLQRLRRIRQLALASLVYPGAVHSRFDHTLGVVHVAGQMARALRLNEDDIETVRLAALLHDIGHGPFSHVSEHILERYADRTKLHPDQKKDKIHELVTASMIVNDADIVSQLGQVTCSKIAQLLATGYGERILRQIVSGPLDADKQDYLLRDSYFCGVQYGVFDHHQLHRSLLSSSDGYDNVLMIKADGVHAVEQYVLAKYYLTTNVYRHKVRLIADQMIVRAAVLGIERDQNKELHQLYAFDNSSDFAKRYACWDDNRFFEVFGGDQSKGKCSMILERLKHRQLLKRVFSGRPLDFKDEVKEQLLHLARQSPDPEVQKKRDQSRGRIETAVGKLIAKQLGQTIDPDMVIYHAFDVKSVKEMSRNDEASILVLKRPLPTKFEDESSLFRSIAEGFNDEFVEIYAPVVWSYHADRDKKCDAMRQEIIEIITSELASASKGAVS